MPGAEPSQASPGSATRLSGRVLEALATAVLVTDAAGRILLANARAATAAAE